MCGIIGGVATRNIVNLLIKGLKFLEYRGYDSAGIAIINKDQKLIRLRTIDKIETLEKLVEEVHLDGNIGIAHTRWATHGSPSEKNAHPHIAGNKVAIVHNGIIENHQSLRAQLLASGFILESETDSELIAHLIYQQLQSGHTLLSATKEAIKSLSGSFAIAVMFSEEPNLLVGVSRGSPLVIGVKENENFISSDPQALLSTTKKFIYLQDGDIAEISATRVSVYDKNDNEVIRKIHFISQDQMAISKNKFEHFMLKEIFEQPEVVQKELEGRLTKNKVLPESFGFNAEAIFSEVKVIHIVGCGTSYHAGLVAKYWLEELSAIACHVEIASEYRYRHNIVGPKTLFIALSQSGETADTLAALRYAKAKNYFSTLAICNVAHSSLTRESELVLMTNAGPEIGVASTKSFTAQLVGLFMLVLSLNTSKQKNAQETAALVRELIQLPNVIAKTLALNEQIKSLSRHFIDTKHVLFIGRGTEFPIALEGALKLKEISYIHAQACPAGELKHGTLALVDGETPVISLLPNNELVDKIKSNLEEIRARQGRLIVFVDEKLQVDKSMGILIAMPSVNKYLAPVIYNIPMQLLAYYIAYLKGKNIDQPRNLAKSVTVE